MKKALLLVAHGSRRAQSNTEIRHLAQRLRERPETPFDSIDCAFLELAFPSIPDAITRLAAAGIQHVVVLPYFLADGRHVHDDIPAQVAIGQRAHPALSIHIRPYIGTAPDMPDLLLSIATQSAPVHSP